MLIFYKSLLYGSTGRALLDTPFIVSGKYSFIL